MKWVTGFFCSRLRAVATFSKSANFTPVKWGAGDGAVACVPCSLLKNRALACVGEGVMLSPPGVRSRLRAAITFLRRALSPARARESDPVPGHMRSRLRAVLTLIKSALSPAWARRSRGSCGRFLKMLIFPP